MTIANTKDVFRSAVGKTITGFYTEDGENRGTGRVYVLVLNDGTGRAFAIGNGSHWTVSQDDVRRRATRRRAELQELDGLQDPTNWDNPPIRGRAESD